MYTKGDENNMRVPCLPAGRPACLFGRQAEEQQNILKVKITVNYIIDMFSLIFFL